MLDATTLRLIRTPVKERKKRRIIIRENVKKIDVMQHGAAVTLFGY
jgi:hypothetical protein